MNAKAPMWCTGCNVWTTKYTDIKLICKCGEAVSPLAPILEIKHNDYWKTIAENDRKGYRENITKLRKEIIGLRHEIDKYYRFVEELTEENRILEARIFYLEGGKREL